MKLNHINIAAPAELLETVREFYCSVLGLEVGFRPQFEQPGFWLYSAEKPLVHLTEREVDQPGPPGGYLNHVAFESSGLHMMIDRLVANKVEYRSSFLSEFNTTQLFFKDPAGTGLEVSFLNEA